MQVFRVWAPLAKKLAVQAGDVRAAMQGPDEHGWWRADVPSAGPGTDYGFLIDGDEKAYPDPRSLWQPKGVHGLSRVYDQSSFAWSDAGFKAPPLADSILYELHVGTFTPEGTLDSAIEKFDELKDLGITHVELMPLASFAGRHGWGYDGVSLYAVHEPYGGPDALKRFVDSAHGKGLAVLLDVVYNHFGPAGNYSGKYGPYTTEQHHTPWGGAVNLEDAWSDEVRRYFCDNALMWMRDFHMDGLRLDAVHAFVDRSAIHFLEQLARETDELEEELRRRLVLIAETDLNDPRVVTGADAGGYGIDAQWSDDFHHALFAVLTGAQGGYYSDFGTMEQLKKSIEQTFVYDGIYSQHRKRVQGRPAAHVSPHRFLGYIQNHDQVGNRAVGDRLHHEVSVDRAMVAAAIVLTAPFIPMIFQGEEWAASTPFQYFADHEDRELARQVSEGRRREFAAFGWNPADFPDPEKKETFERSKLDWAEVDRAEHARMRAWYKDLIQLRRSSPDLNDGRPGQTQVTYDAAEQWLRMKRDSIELFCNLGGRPAQFAVDGSASLLLNSRPDAVLRDGSLTIAPDAAAILRA
jgi:maltooligosyltrehalose trehalohydrolase